LRNGYNKSEIVVKVDNKNVGRIKHADNYWKFFIKNQAVCQAEFKNLIDCQSFIKSFLLDEQEDEVP